MGIYINRIINMKKIKAIGFDMDYTLVRYQTEAFENFTHGVLLKKLVENKNYPKEILKLSFDFSLVIQGLVIEKNKGNILKLSRYGKVKMSYHGTKPISYKEQQRIYANSVIDLNDTNIQSLDTSFSISNGVLFAQLVEMKDEGLNLPDYETLATDIRKILDLAHADGTLKNEVRNNLGKYILQDKNIPYLLERYRRFGKKLLVITNSDFAYTKLLLDYTINPFLEEYDSWQDLFEITITLSSKPSFFTSLNRFLSVNPNNGFMTNFEGDIVPGIYQGGHAGKLQNDLGLEGDEILYLGDHIYGDVVTIKKTFNWRTGMVLGPLEDEIEHLKQTRPIQDEIDSLMTKKQTLERSLNELDLRRREKHKTVDRKEIDKLFAEIDGINTQISDLLERYREFFNPHWGEMMRSGQEESRFADQVEKYACIYMAKVSDLLGYSPKTYFRPHKRILPHEIHI